MSEHEKNIATDFESHLDLALRDVRWLKVLAGFISVAISVAVVMIVLGMFSGGDMSNWLVASVLLVSSTLLIAGAGLLTFGLLKLDRFSTDSQEPSLSRTLFALGILLTGLLMVATGLIACTLCVI
ncbi:MAG: hypothetical protein KDA65_15130 [Planctomycetaceae bacterium]|nr:hypothetical protein [Planctomycetaceae bacterium]